MTFRKWLHNKFGIHSVTNHFCGHRTRLFCNSEDGKGEPESLGKIEFKLKEPWEL